MSKVRADRCQLDTTGDKVVLLPFGGFLFELWMERKKTSRDGAKIK